MVENILSGFAPDQRAELREYKWAVELAACQFRKAFELNPQKFADEDSAFKYIRTICRKEHDRISELNRLYAPDVIEQAIAHMQAKAEKGYIWRNWFSSLKQVIEKDIAPVHKPDVVHASTESPKREADIQHASIAQLASKATAHITTASSSPQTFIADNDELLLAYIKGPKGLEELKLMVQKNF